MIEHTVEIPTKDGATTTFIVHPDRDGPHPVVLFFMDAPAIREELRDMARRIAAAGYYVMLPNLYYRKGVMELKDLPPLPEDQARARMFELLADAIQPRFTFIGEAVVLGSSFGGGGDEEGVPGGVTGLDVVFDPLRPLGPFRGLV